MTNLQTRKLLFFAISTLLIVGLYFVLSDIQSRKSTITQASSLDNGMQIIEVTAKNGFTPSNIQAKSGTPTIIRVSTNDTYDCSAAINIPAINYSHFLPPNGETDIQLLPQKSGTQISASCSMGMYGFTVEFI